MAENIAFRSCATMFPWMVNSIAVTSHVNGPGDGNGILPEYASGRQQTITTGMPQLKISLGQDTYASGYNQMSSFLSQALKSFSVSGTFHANRSSLASHGRL
jgi:hypothetical protein